MRGRVGWGIGTEQPGVNIMERTKLIHTIRHAHTVCIYCRLMYVFHVRGYQNIRTTSLLVNAQIKRIFLPGSVFFFHETPGNIQKYQKSIIK